MTVITAKRCRGQFINNHVEHSPDCADCAEQALHGKVQCSVCGLAMLPCNLERHMRIHNDQRPFRCAQCARPFNQKEHLVEHLRAHSSERKFVCVDCGKTFRRESGLRHHRMTHSEERPFACSDCGRKFKYRTSFMHHKRRVHGYHYTCRFCPAQFATRKEYTAHHVEHQRNRRAELQDLSSDRGFLETHKRTIIDAAKLQI